MDNYKTAGFGKRFLGFIIDFLCILLLAQLIALLFKDQFENIFHFQASLDQYNNIGISMGVLDSSTLKPIEGISSADIQAFNEATKDILSEYNNNQLFLNIILYSIGFLIFQFIVPLILKDGRSIGKIITKTKVVKKDNKAIGVGTLLLRNMVGMCLIEYILSMLLMFLPLTISGSLVLASESKRSLHDYLAGTKVVITMSDEEIAEEKRAKERKNEKPNPYHKTYKGFEFIDVEALEKKNINNVQNEPKVSNNNEQVVDNVEETKEEQQDK